MNDDELELAEALRRELHDMGADVHPSARLTRRIEQIPDRRRQRARIRLMVPAGAVIVAVILVVAFVVAGSSPPVAQALTISVGGRTVRVTLQEIEAVGPANGKFTTLGRVMAVVMTPTCPTPTRGLDYAGLADPPAPRISLGNPTAGKSVTEIIAARQIGPRKFILAIGTVNGKVPSCVSSKGVGPGLPGWHLLPRDRLPPGPSRSGG